MGANIYSSKELAVIFFLQILIFFSFFLFFFVNLKDWFVLDIVTIYIVIESNCVVLFIVDLHVGNIAILK